MPTITSMTSQIDADSVRAVISCSDVLGGSADVGKHTALLPFEPRPVF